MERIMGLDVGDKTIGVAISDLLQMTAQGITTIKRESKEKDYKALEEIINEYGIKKVVVGLPKNMNGTLGPQGEKTIKFADKLKNKYKVEIIYEDERLTTQAAEKMLISGEVRRDKRKTVIDKVAATFILQTYLDRKGRIL
ncbi:Holliday junction resolvase RuvX [Tissierella carlieri]|jgi:putative Holliday junction resolvase|uniref:Putative pre-16S rRNA nuclease n=1 Tax=Tissierella carlieri TaxID=689904 RepID=A0ABT1S4W4_9FIRM|nr:MULTISPECIES: Holliday junction resolvase RuvX [Tissierella]MBU5310949.1 Holliday junction resolvase RuvX [Tissierella carlieri]MCQ4921494.1 Holliday junction resolvase RuvX [Tissierella carlieri]MDU5081631.1 Holliday junction resolvase RuvX [Bacillota bacterium]OZV12713.1 Holliday junction resolvase RuvX [Tissierella sp. P1]